MNSIEHVDVSTPQGSSGALLRAGGDYLFQYAPDASAPAAIALNMPRRAEQYRRSSLFPIFEMNLPEGYVLDAIRQRFAKVSTLDPMLLLALTGRDAAIGRLSVTSPSMEGGEPDAGVDLSTILSWSGTEDLFQALSERYLLRTGLSGVQPKVLVPEAMSPSAGGKAAMATSDLIVKSAGDDFPGLAVNEYLCMSIAREAGVPVPEFYLSENRKLFVVRRFDRTEAGGAIGFEDMASLMGRSAQDKYRGSYRHIAQAIDAFCTSEHRATGKAQLFDQVALSVMLGNGDAHLKNFGLLYTHPLADDARMAPAYDIVNTTRYIPEDTLALSLGGSKSLFTARADILAFGLLCGVEDPVRRAEELVQAAETVFFLHGDLLAEDPGLGAELRRSVQGFARACEQAPVFHP